MDNKVVIRHTSPQKQTQLQPNKSSLTLPDQSTNVSEETQFLSQSMSSAHISILPHIRYRVVIGQTRAGSAENPSDLEGGPGGGPASYEPSRLNTSFSFVCFQGHKPGTSKAAARQILLGRIGTRKSLSGCLKPREKTASSPSPWAPLFVQMDNCVDNVFVCASPPRTCYE